MSDLVQKTTETESKSQAKSKKSLKIILLGSAIALKATAYYLGIYQAGIHLNNQEYSKAVKYHASGYIPGTAGNLLLGYAGLSYLRKFIKKRKSNN